MSYKPQGDLNHNFVSADHRYGCFQKPSSRITRIWIQCGWVFQIFRRVRRHKTEWINNGCGHSYKATDPSCTGCKWRDHA